MKIIHLLAAAALISVASISTSFAATATNESCEAMFAKLDANSDGSLAGAEAAKVEEAMTKSSVKAKDAGIVQKDEFLEQCMKDMFVGMDQ
jgi:hypothetical protein